MINLPLLKRQILRLVAGTKGYEELCDRQWVLHPGEQLFAPAAIYQPGALDHVTGVQAETTLDLEIERIQGGMRTHGATTAYQFRDVQIRQGYLYTRSLRQTFSTRPESWWQSGPITAIAEAALASTQFGARYFGHLLLDDVPLAMVAQQVAPAITVIPPPNEQFREYTTLFEIPTRFVLNANCQRLTLINDIGQNRFKRDRLRQLRSHLQPLATPNRPRGVMLLRGQSGSQRSLVNEAEVIRWLQAQGFVCLMPETLSVTELLRQTLGARIIIGVEGSQLAHGVYSLAAGGVMCALQPPYRFNNVFKDYLDCIDQDLRYAFVVGRPVDAGFVIDLNDLARTLEVIEQVLTC
jgi:hypothetical protein